MAYDTQFQPSQDIVVYLGVEATFGTATLAAGTWYKPQVTSFSLPESASSVEMAAQRSGAAVNFSNQVNHRPDTKVYTFDLTLRGTVSSIARACQLMFEDSSSAHTLTGTYAFPTTYKDGTSSTSQMTVLFKNGGQSDSDSKGDLVAKSCVATGISFAQDTGSEGGDLMVTINMMTAYQPAHSSLTPSSSTDDTASAKNIRSLTNSTTLVSNPLMLYSWELALSRSVERISYKDTTNFDPYGYAMTGAVEVSGSLSAKMDAETFDLIASFHANTGALNIQESSGFTVSVPLVAINEAAIDSGGPHLIQTLPFIAVGNSASTGDNVVSITAS